MTKRVDNPSAPRTTLRVGRRARWRGAGHV